MSVGVTALLVISTQAAGDTLTLRTDLVRRLFSEALLRPDDVDSLIATHKTTLDKDFSNCLRRLRVQAAQLEMAMDYACQTLDTRESRMGCLSANPLRGTGYVLADLEIATHGRAAWLETVSGRAANTLLKIRSDQLAAFDANAYDQIENVLGSKVADDARQGVIDSDLAQLRSYVAAAETVLVCREL
jgi:hypothetical protein